MTRCRRRTPDSTTPGDLGGRCPRLPGVRGQGFAWENQGLVEPRDVMALLREWRRRHGRQLERAHVLVDVEQGRSAPPVRTRQPIPREVLQAVFVRDGRRCVECGLDVDTQYDRVIPWSLGGADSVANLQLLCGSCNHAKGAGCSCRHCHDESGPRLEKVVSPRRGVPLSVRATVAVLS